MSQPTPESLALAAKHGGGAYLDTNGEWDMYERALVHRDGSVFWSASLKVFVGATIAASSGELRTGELSTIPGGWSIGYR